jgi:adenine-specific DNA-methyltransferase
MAKKQSLPLDIDIFRHDEATRKNIPTAEHQSVMDRQEQSAVRVAYERRNRDLDPQLVWRGKDEQDWSDLVVSAPPLYIQEKVHPKVLIDDLMRRSRAEAKAADTQFDLFADFNGLPDDNAKTEFYQHDAHWANRMILGDSLQVMASLAEREGLRGKVQCIYLDPPYGIRFNSNFQWSTTSRDVKDGNTDHITREPEQVKAFRDTWRDGIHSYLTYLRDRLTVARDLLTESGSIFVQIGDENVHRVRALMDEVFGDQNFLSLISFQTSTGRTSKTLDTVSDYILWYAKNNEVVKFRQLFAGEEAFASSGIDFKGEYELGDMTSQHPSEKRSCEIEFRGEIFKPSSARQWAFDPQNIYRLEKADRVFRFSEKQIRWKKYGSERAKGKFHNIWTDTQFGAFSSDKIYVVQTHRKVIERCILMATDPGDLVIDPTCGSGTTAYVAEQWGRRWITIDTSRVALALARARIMGARYSYYLLADSRDGQLREAEITASAPSSQPTRGDIRHGFVYERVPHITLKSIANNAEIDVIWERHQEQLEPLRQQLNKVLGKEWQEWEIPREASKSWPDQARSLHAAWWEMRIARQQGIDASIAAKAEFEYLYDKPCIDRKKVRVAGPFTVESLSPHRVLGVDEEDGLIDSLAETGSGYDDQQSFVSMILENLRTSGVQQAHKSDKIDFISLTPWPGELVCAEGRYLEADGTTERRAAIFIGPEFGTVSRPDLVGAAREAGDAGFDVLVACAFNYDAHSSEFNKLGRIPVLKARMNADLHMSGDLKNTGKGNLFVIFGEPDIDLLDAENGQIRVRVNGVDVFHPNTGEVRSDGAEGIACWFIDTDYNMESFFVRHAYFLGANDPYKALKTTLKAEINEETWSTLNSDISRPFAKPATGRIAVKVINHLGDEVMKVYRVG